MGRVLGDRVTEMKGSRTITWYSQNSHMDSIGNIVSNYIVTMYGARGVLEISGCTLCKVYDCLTSTLYT